MPAWTILADDLTGACDTGVAFAQRGYATRVAFTPDADFHGAQVRVVTTESRGLPVDQAVRVVEQAVRALRLGKDSHIYKKIDSTLRGHPGEELAAVMRAAGIDRALVTPAFPAQGRVVRDGRVFLHGVALEDTSTGYEVAGPDLLGLFSPAGKIRHISYSHDGLNDEQVGKILSSEIGQIVVADAESDEDLVVLAQAVERAGIRLLCGSAGLARALVKGFPAGGSLIPLDKHPNPALVVAGSWNPVTVRQVRVARVAGIAATCPSFDDLRIAKIGEQEYSADSKEEDSANRIPYGNSIGVELARYLLQNQNVVLHLGALEHLPGREADVAGLLAGATAVALAHAQVSGLVLTGGETAMEVCRALGCAAIDLGGEVQPGVVWGRLAGGPFAGLPVITKAGGFGDDQTLIMVVRFLQEGT